MLQPILTSSWISTQTTPNTGSAAEYGTSEFGIGEYGGNTLIPYSTKFNMGGTGQHLRIAIQIPIPGAAINIQKLDIFMKKGRISV